MIGDNPDSDIRGANDNGMVSILVKTGVFKGDNHDKYPAHHVVHDFAAAVSLIWKLERI